MLGLSSRGQRHWPMRPSTADRTLVNPFTAVNADDVLPTFHSHFSTADCAVVLSIAKRILVFYCRTVEPGHLVMSGTRHTLSIYFKFLTTGIMQHIYECGWRLAGRSPVLWLDPPLSFPGVFLRWTVTWPSPVGNQILIVVINSWVFARVHELCNTCSKTF